MIDHSFKKHSACPSGFFVATVLAFISLLSIQATAAPPEATPAATSGLAKAEDPIDAMLAEFGLHRDTLSPDPTSLLLRSRGTLASPLTLRFLLHPLQIPYVAGQLAAEYRRWSFSIVRTALIVVGQTPAELSRGYIGDPLAKWDEQLVKSDDPLLAGAEAVWEAANPKAKKIPAETRAKWEEASKALSPAWRREIGRLLMASADATAWQRKAFESVEDKDRPLLKRSPMEGLNDESDLRPVIRKTDFNYLYAGAMDIAIAAEDFENFLDSSPTPYTGPYDLETPLGHVLLRGATGDDHLDPNPPVHYLLVIDLGGNDDYGSGMTIGGYDYPVQMIFDAAGDDRYIADNKNTPSWGGAMAGYSLLLDRSGNDEYQGVLASEGAALLGAGFLIDRAGNDRYTAFGICQGCGYAGIGILQDGGGDDHYEALTRAQGCGDSLGAGTLLDQSGNDQYVLNDTIIRVPSPQTSKHNASMGQGTGLGYRADLTDGHSVPGGVGVLYDLAGNDSYSAGVFAQGCGYLGGTGLLMDDAGSDTLKAVYYVQGASAHRGVGVVIDRGGNDVYEAQMQCAQGCGHDLGVGWLLDMGGNDRYSALRLAQGAGNENGWGFCVDLGGDDSYTVTAPGASADSEGADKQSKWGTMREDMPSLGFFLDAGGHDTYKGVKGAGDGKRWTYPEQYPSLDLRSERGVGWDGDFKSVNLRTGPLTPFPKSEFKEYADQQRLRRRYREGRKH